MREKKGILINPGALKKEKRRVKDGELRENTEAKKPKKGILKLVFSLIKEVFNIFKSEKKEVKEKIKEAKNDKKRND